jgi:hypothetical protein
MSTKTSLDTFTQAYIECAFWSSNDELTENGGEPLDKNYGIEDLAPETLAKMIEDCKKFQEENWDDISSDPNQAGHDFWLTRNGHGAGFWDGPWETELGQKLSNASEAYNRFDLYIGDDGKIYA